MAEQGQRIKADKVRAGSSDHVVRYVLAASLALAVAVMVLLLWL